MPVSTRAMKVRLDIGSLHILETTSEVKSDLVFEIGDPNYLLIHVHIAYMYSLWVLLAASKVTTASKQPQRSNLTSDLKSVTPFTYYLSMCI